MFAAVLIDRCDSFLGGALVCACASPLSLPPFHVLIITHVPVHFNRNNAQNLHLHFVYYVHVQVYKYVIELLKEVIAVPISESRKRANEKYNAKAYDQVKIIVKKGEREKIKAHAESKGMSLNGYINALIDADMQKTASED